jgi:hypothetical protein
LQLIGYSTSVSQEKAATTCSLSDAAEVCHKSSAATV